MMNSLKAALPESWLPGPVREHLGVGDNARELDTLEQYK